VVLHDGAAEGHRIVQGAEYPVFNVLTTLEPSRYNTFVIELASATAEAIDVLQSIAERHQAAAENWGTSTRRLCRACSLGTPHEHPDHAVDGVHPHCGLAALDSGHAERIIQEWLATVHGSDLLRWYPASDAAA
jgi:hypothetical protein